MKNIHLYLSVFTFSCFTIIFYGCTKNNEGEPPCADCPINYSIIDFEPAWSPDGEWIAYYHGDSRPGYNGIYLIRPDGTGNHLWQPRAVETPAWSPDGKWIAFSYHAHIWKKKFDGDSLTQLTFQGRNFFPSWSPYDNLIVYVQSVCSHMPCGLWLLNIECNIHTSIVLYGMYPDFNPFNKQILFRTKWVEKNGNVLGDSVFLYDYNSGIKSFLVALINANWDNSFFKYNNSGTKVLFTSQPRDGDGLPGLWIMNDDGSNVKRLTSQAYSADWSPDGSRIVFTDSRKINGRLWIMDADGNNKKQLTFEHHFN
ncbi:MAG: DPP IV N-terminal domain-containing protein [Bacteroidales bacterium]|nr:DPP IV N-terminal domain-containing protein [Bacteroidales bacterium]MDZ4203628.1 DPP IV N-terminal domain-containing protein [Bacteroidales bacterium]